jgi:hypothetical protein
MDSAKMLQHLNLLEQETRLANMKTKFSANFIIQSSDEGEYWKPNSGISGTNWEESKFKKLTFPDAVAEEPVAEDPIFPIAEDPIVEEIPPAK